MSLTAIRTEAALILGVASALAFAGIITEDNRFIMAGAVVATMGLIHLGLLLLLREEDRVTDYFEQEMARDDTA